MFLFQGSKRMALHPSYLLITHVITTVAGWWNHWLTRWQSWCWWVVTWHLSYLQWKHGWMVVESFMEWLWHPAVSWPDDCRFWPQLSVQLIHLKIVPCYRHATCSVTNWFTRGYAAKLQVPCFNMPRHIIACQCEKWTIWNWLSRLCNL